MEETDNTESEKSCNELLAFIFSDYPSLVKHIAPEGWDKSLFKKFHHPTAEQQFEEYKRITDNLARLSKKEAGHYDKTLVDIQNEYLDEKSKDPDATVPLIRRGHWKKTIPPEVLSFSSLDGSLGEFS
jgi:hypothetical protein